MQKFDPASPPRRKMKYVITDSEGNQFEHYVTGIPVGVVDRILEIVGEIWGGVLVKGESGNLELMIGDAIKKYPAEIVEVVSLMTGYDEDDIKKWDADILLEMILDWIDGNMKGFKETWSKKKGALGELFTPENKPEKEPKKEPEIPLSLFESDSGVSSGPPTTTSDSDTPKSTG